MINRIASVICLSFMLLSSGALASQHGHHDHGSQAHPDEHVIPDRDDGRIYTTTGVLEAVDLQDGTLTVTHDPVPELGWPLMTMRFTLEDSALAEGLQAKDRVRLDFRNEAGAAVIVDIERR